MNRRSFLTGTAALTATPAVAGCELPGMSASANGGRWSPSENITMVVPFSAGGGSDLAGRACAAALEKALPEVRITVENRTGASGAVGYSYFLSKRGNPDYLLASETALLALPRVHDVEFSYHAFTPIMKVADDYTLVVVQPDSPWQDCRDLVDASTSGRVIAGISGTTGLDNIVFTLMERRAGASFDRVPFESGGELMAALLGGQIDVASLNPGEIIGQLESGDLRALCVCAEQSYDYPELADIPTARSQGIDVAYAQFRGLIAPGGIPAKARDHWIDAVRRSLDTAEYERYVADNFLQPNQLAGADFAAYLRRADAQLSEVLG